MTNGPAAKRVEATPPGGQRRPPAASGPSQCCPSTSVRVYSDHLHCASVARSPSVGAGAAGTWAHTTGCSLIGSDPAANAACRTRRGRSHRPAPRRGTSGEHRRTGGASVVWPTLCPTEQNTVTVTSVQSAQSKAYAWIVRLTEAVLEAVALHYALRSGLADVVSTSDFVPTGQLKPAS
jgi:hypothetical protein